MLEFILIVIAIIGFSSAAFFFYLLRKSDAENERMESYIIEVNDVLSTFKGRVEDLFKMNIHYYDDTIFQFIEMTKQAKLHVDSVMAEYEELQKFIVPEKTKEQEVEELQKEVLGIVKPPIYPLRK